MTKLYGYPIYVSNDDPPLKSDVISRLYCLDLDDLEIPVMITYSMLPAYRKVIVKLEWIIKDIFYFIKDKQFLKVHRLRRKKLKELNKIMRFDLPTPYGAINDVKTWGPYVSDYLILPKKPYAHPTKGVRIMPKEKEYSYICRYCKQTKKGDPASTTLHPFYPCFTCYECFNKRWSILTDELEITPSKVSGKLKELD